MILLSPCESSRCTRAIKYQKLLRRDAKKFDELTEGMESRIRWIIYSLVFDDDSVLLADELVLVKAYRWARDESKRLAKERRKRK